MITLDQSLARIRRKLNDIKMEVWTDDQLKDYLQCGYEAFCRDTECVFDMVMFDNQPLTANYTKDSDREYMDQPVLAKFNITRPCEEQYVDGEDAVCSNHTRPSDAEYMTEDGHEPTTRAIGRLPETFVKVERVTHNWLRLMPEFDRYHRLTRTAYQTLEGNVFSYQMDQDGMFALRVVNVPVTELPTVRIYGNQYNQYGMIRMDTSYGEVTGGEDDDVVWSSVAGATTVVSGNTIYSTAPNPAFNNGALSSVALEYGAGNVTATIRKVCSAGESVCIGLRSQLHGLSTVNPPFSASSADYMFSQGPTGVVVIEGYGIGGYGSKTSVASVAVGDKLKIAVDDDFVVTYYINDTLVYTSQMPADQRRGYNAGYLPWYMGGGVSYTLRGYPYDVMFGCYGTNVGLNDVTVSGFGWETADLAGSRGFVAGQASYTTQWTITLPIPVYGFYRQVPQQFASGTQYGFIRRIVPDDKATRVELSRIGKDLIDHPYEIPDRAVNYVESWAMARAYGLPGEGENTVLADHFTKRYQLGVKITKDRVNNADRERTIAIGRKRQNIRDNYLEHFPADYGYSRPFRRV